MKTRHYCTRLVFKNSTYMKAGLSPYLVAARLAQCGIRLGGDRVPFFTRLTDRQTDRQVMDRIGQQSVWSVVGCRRWSIANMATDLPLIDRPSANFVIPTWPVIKLSLQLSHSSIDPFIRTPSPCTVAVYSSAYAQLHQPHSHILILSHSAAGARKLVWKYVDFQVLLSPNF